MNEWLLMFHGELSFKFFYHSFTVMLHIRNDFEWVVKDVSVS